MGSDLTQSYFELFDLPVSFEIDLSDLSERFRKLQRATHPDKFANASERERRISIQKAALVNEAYQCLKSPVSRARYMLEQRGVEFNDERDTSFDPEFLMEQMELRERLGNIKGSAQPVHELNGILQTIALRGTRLQKHLASQLQSEADEAPVKAKELVLKLQFIEKLRTESESMEEQLYEDKI